MNHTEFAVSRFENRNGVTSWRIDGYVHGVRFRKNFKTREEAAAEKAAQEIKTEQNASGLHTVTTCLTVEQVRDAEAVFRRLEGRSGTLGYYFDYALKNYRDPARNMPLAEGPGEYLALRHACSAWARGFWTQETEASTNISMSRARFYLAGSEPPFAAVSGSPSRAKRVIQNFPSVTRPLRTQFP